MPRPKTVRVVSTEEVWLKFLGITNALQPVSKRLSEKEMEIVAYLCTQNPSSEQLKGTALKRAMTRFPTIKQNYFAQIKHNLMEKGWLDKEGYISQHIRPMLQKFWDSRHTIPYTEIEISFKITTRTAESEFYDRPN